MNTPVHPAFKTAERLAPVPKTRDEATADAWTRHWAALALAAHTAFHDALPRLQPAPEVGPRPELGYLMAIATAATAATYALAGVDLDIPRERIAAKLWDLTPGAGALNGEYLDWLTQILDRFGINPADINPRYDAADFYSQPQPASADQNTG